jgi:hypothetical protein
MRKIARYMEHVRRGPLSSNEPLHHAFNRCAHTSFKPTHCIACDNMERVRWLVRACVCATWRWWPWCRLMHLYDSSFSMRIGVHFALFHTAIHGGGTPEQIAKYSDDIK